MGSTLYESLQTKLPYAPSQEAKIVYYEPPLPYMELHIFADNSNMLHMNFQGSIAEQPTQILIDTGASHNFIDSTFAINNKLLIKTENGKVNCGGNTTAAITGSIYAWLTITPDYGHQVKLYVTDLPTGHPVILGNTWLIKHCAILDHERHEMRLKMGSQRIKISCPSATHYEEGGQQPAFLNYLQARELIREGGTPILAVIREAEDEEQHKHLGEVAQILEEYKEVFQDLPPGLPPDRGSPFIINTGDNAPVSGKGYRLTPKEKDQVESQIKDYLAKEWIRPSQSPYAAAILFVQKKDGSLRMCVDYRGLNKTTVKDKYPLPRIDDLVDKLFGATVFSSLDLQSGYHQIRIAEQDVHKTAFITPQGLYEYRVMPFGLCNAPSAFQRHMNMMFSHLPYAVVYLDDILVFSKSQTEHQGHLRTVLSILKENHFYAKLSKCSFYQTSTKFLGFVVDKDGIRMDPDKVSAVVNWPLPTSASELSSFLGLSNHYKRFLHDYSRKIAALSELTHNNRPYNLKDNPEALQAFEWLKKAITTAPVLAAPNFEAPFYVITDASGFGIGAVLMQDDASSPATKRPIAFHSARLSDAERNYPVGEQDLLAVIDALKKWRCYLEGAKGGVTIVTDHLPNTFLDTKSAEQLSRRQVRWQLELSRINPKWVYEKGQFNAADPLSRCPELLCVSALQVPSCAHRHIQTPVRDTVDQTGLLGLANRHPDINSLHEYDSGPAILLTVAQQPVPDGITEIMADIAEWYKTDNQSELRMRQSRSYTFHEGIWRYGNLVIVPEDYNLKRRCIAINHDPPTSGHPGRTITLELIQRHFWWPTIRRDVFRYVDTCTSCQLNKNSTQKPAGLLQPLAIPEYPWQQMSMDLITHLPPTIRGYTSIAVFVDRLTKMVHFAPCHDTMTAADFAELFISEIFRRHGLPETIVSDRDTKFTSAFFVEICRHLGIKQSMSTAYHAQTDGQTERTNRTLEEMLRHYISPTQDDWDLRLPCAEFAVNNAVKAATGYTPFYLNYGRHPRSPSAVQMQTNIPAANELVGSLSEALTRARDCLTAAQARMKRFADQRRRDLEFSIGDKVLLNSRNIRIKSNGTRKLLPKFLGPFSITKKVGTLAYQLELPASMGKTHPVFHVSLLRPYHATSDQSLPPMPTVVDGEMEFEVERILNHRDIKISQNSRRTKREYLVKWSGYGHEHNSWESAKDCGHSQDLIQDYHASTQH